MLADLLHHGDRWLAAHGGRGGRGNARFLSNARRAPSFAEQGEYGEDAAGCDLELRLMADAALVGFPNAGKSTLISAVSAAKPKIAELPVHHARAEPRRRALPGPRVRARRHPRAHRGRGGGHGLGHQFLRHVERARVLVVLLDLAPMDGAEPGGAGARCCSTSSAATGPSCSSGRGSSSAPRPTSPTLRLRRPEDLGGHPPGPRPAPRPARRRSSTRRAPTSPSRSRSCVHRPEEEGFTVVRDDDGAWRVKRPRGRAGRRRRRPHQRGGARPTSSSGSGAWASRRRSPGPGRARATSCGSDRSSSSTSRGSGAG